MILGTGWNRWTFVQGVIAVLAAVVACLPGWVDMYVSATNDADNGYIVLVPAVVLWLALLRRRRLRSAGRRGLWMGPVVAVLAGGVYVHGGLTGTSLSLHLGAIGMLIGAVLSVVGRSVLLRMLPAVVALFFLAPVPMAWLLPLTERLGAWTLIVTAGLLEVLGVPALASGSELSVGTNRVALVGDSGLRMMAAIGLVSYAFAYGTPLRQGVRVGIVLAAPLVALVANVLRLVPYALLAAHWPMATGVLSQLSGWLTLLLAFLMLYGGIRVLRYAQVPALRYALAYQ
ncbi:MAG: exosortase/archaeosortase family protein [Phycisphaeraceae bacterium]|nr:exosortase/archaeosortase family protein [Phycisphaeraceae bacterium]